MVFFSSVSQSFITMFVETLAYLACHKQTRFKCTYLVWITFPIY